MPSWLGPASPCTRRRSISLVRTRGQLVADLRRLFRDDGGGFFQTGSDAEPLLVRPRELYDNATPSGNSASAEVLLRMAHLPGRPTSTKPSRRCKVVRDGLRRAPRAFGLALCVLDREVGPHLEVAIVGNPDDGATRALAAEATSRRYPPEPRARGGGPRTRHRSGLCRSCGTGPQSRDTDGIRVRALHVSAARPDADGLRAQLGASLEDRSSRPRSLGSTGRWRASRRRATCLGRARARRVGGLGRDDEGGDQHEPGGTGADPRPDRRGRGGPPGRSDDAYVRSLQVQDIRQRGPYRSRHTLGLPVDGPVVPRVRAEPSPALRAAHHRRGSARCRYRDLLNRSDLNLPDGMPGLGRSQEGGADPPPPGTDAMNLVTSWGVEQGMRHYLYGATEDTLGLLRQEHGRGSSGHPGRGRGDRLRSARSPTRSSTRPSLASQPRAPMPSGSDSGAPKQDVIGDWLRERERGTDAVRGRRGVRLHRRHEAARAGLDEPARVGSVLRLASEPGRLWKRYLVGNTRFVVGVASDRLGRGST